MTKTYKYQTIGSSKLPQPFLPLTLRYHNHSLTIKALVVSGADFCVFNGELYGLLAPDINLNTFETTRLSSVDGATKGYVTHIEIGVDRTFFSVPVIFHLNSHRMILMD